MNSIIKRLGALCLGLGVLLVPALAIGEVETLGSNRKEGIENKSPRKQHELVERYVDRYKGSKEDPIKVEEPHFNVGIKVIKVKQEESSMSQMDGISDSRITDEKNKMVMPGSRGIIPVEKVKPWDGGEQQPLGRKGGIIIPDNKVEPLERVEEIQY
tara:strand:+ start:630 stop:1100 length:471 start_codon:yes stop_codon:yes gene_type:complete